MEYPYDQSIKSLFRALKKIIKMIAWLAKHTLSQEEYREFVKEFVENEPCEKPDLKEELKKW